MNALLFLLLSIASPANAQMALQLSSQNKLNMQDLVNRGEIFLFIQEDCEACEKALSEAARCAPETRNKVNLVALESESWALKKSVSSMVVKMSPRSFYSMTRAEAKKLGVIGTPTFLSRHVKIMKELKCSEIKNLIREANTI